MGFLFEARQKWAKGLHMARAELLDALGEGPSPLGTKLGRKGVDGFDCCFRFRDPWAWV